MRVPCFSFNSIGWAYFFNNWVLAAFYVVVAASLLFCAGLLYLRLLFKFIMDKWSIFTFKNFTFEEAAQFKFNFFFYVWLLNNFFYLLWKNYYYTFDDPCRRVYLFWMSFLRLHFCWTRVSVSYTFQFIHSYSIRFDLCVFWLNNLYVADVFWRAIMRISVCYLVLSFLFNAV